MPHTDTLPSPLADANGRLALPAPAQNLEELISAMDQLRHEPVINLRQALEQLDVLKRWTRCRPKTRSCCAVVQASWLSGS